jgi:CheY-like chemotaxis protein
MSEASSPKHILVVDDEPLLRDIIARVLRHEGHEVATAADGEDGLEKFKGGTWDVVVTDFEMPNMNGEEMTAAIKKIAPDIPVIMMTGSNGIVKDSSVFEAFIPKPFHAPELLVLIESLPVKDGGDSDT